MNLRCTICDAVIARRASADRCPECGARAIFQVPTKEAPRPAQGAAGDSTKAWEFSPDGPVLLRFR
jgi:phage FluMu protein Com